MWQRCAASPLRDAHCWLFEPAAPSPNLGRRAPTLKEPGATTSELTPSSALVTVTAPTDEPPEGPWAAFQLDVCRKGAQPADCLELSPCLQDTTPTDGTACPVSGELVQGATYTVVATACATDDCLTGTKSLASAPGIEFVVPFQ